MVERAKGIPLSLEEEVKRPARLEMPVIAGDRAEKLYGKFRRGESLMIGQMAKILHLLNPEEQDHWRKKIDEEQKRFWQIWTDFRCGLAEGGEPVFDDVIKLLSVREEFANFIGIQGKRPLVIDLMGGSANMAPHFFKKRKFWGMLTGRDGENDLAGYVTIDNNPLVKEIAERQLAQLGIDNAYVMTHNLMRGLPPKLSEIIKEANPDNISYISNWGLTYLPADDQNLLIRACFDPETNGGRPSSLSINMITEGQFDREVLEREFKRKVVPSNLHRPGLLRRAIKALPLMREFGDAFPKVSPLWFPEEVVEIGKNAGCEVVELDPSLLSGQSTAITFT